jgi:uncharacterized membrane protein
MDTQTRPLEIGSGAANAPALRQEPCVFSATITPHRSLSWVGFRRLFTALALIFTGVSGVFFALGAWPIIGFMGLEWLGLYWAFRVSYRQADAREIVQVWRDETRLTRISAKGQSECISLNTAWVQVINEESQDAPRPLYLRSHGRSYAFAAVLTAGERRGLARALRQGLAQAQRAWSA